ncbi:major facilitator superfamily domain-containing protein [Roridomyces roridus]|uniref:Major facilitator superfamily domain-containing protein n=1 Tax=Roridomyces roridus TaxID=1738132 RepID=A0AAD7BWW7_9AGAR|nr:major facilitator superfamily domain-containing protein [Roridomyces roridus]
MAPSSPRSRSRGSLHLQAEEDIVQEEAAELLHEYIHPHHYQEETLVDEPDSGDDTRRSEQRHLPWWRRPSPWWLLVATPLSTIAMSATLAPKVGIYQLLVCSVQKPEIFEHTPILPNLLLQEYSIGKTTFPPSFDIALGNTSAPDTSECATDPVVAAEVAKLSTVITTTMGILGCLTTAWWGSVSDRFGRTRILGLTLFGLLVNDLIFLFVTLNRGRVPGGYWFLVLGAVLEGLAGGFSTGSATSHAYLADTTSSSERSRIFSLFLGVVFTGLGLGPALGGLMIRYTHNTLSVFYMATGFHAIYTILAWVFLPESLTKAQMESASVRYDEAIRLQQEQESTILSRFSRVFSFMKPLAIFYPQPVETTANSSKGRKRDWNLLLLAAAYGFTISIMASNFFTFQYLTAQFNWTPEIVGYLLTINGVTRALHLALFLPLAIKVVKFFTKRSRAPETVPLLDTSPKQHSVSFDISLARVSLLIDVIGYAGLPFAPTGFIFTLFTMVCSFGTAFSPAVQSTALELYTRKIGGRNESGKLFGALSVVQALAGQILGPSLYGTVYMKTVGTFPKAIFFVSITNLLISFICLGLVRLPEHVRADEEDTVVNVVAEARDATVVDGEALARHRKKDTSTSDS